MQWNSTFPLILETLFVHYVLISSEVFLTKFTSKEVDKHSGNFVGVIDCLQLSKIACLTYPGHWNRTCMRGFTGFLKARYQICLLNWELGVSSRAMAIPVLFPSSFKICGEEWFWRTLIFSKRNWGLVKAFLRTYILRCCFSGWFFWGGEGGGCCVCWGFVLFCFFFVLFWVWGFFALVECNFQHHSSFGWCFVWQKTIISIGRWYSLAKSCWKTELNWGKSVKGSQMVITSSHICVCNGCKGCGHCFETSKKVSGISHAVKVTLEELSNWPKRFVPSRLGKQTFCLGICMMSVNGCFSRSKSLYLVI